MHEHLECAMTELPDYTDLPPAPRGGRSAWGLFGAGDNLGLVNLMTPERIAAAASFATRCPSSNAANAFLQCSQFILHSRGACAREPPMGARRDPGALWSQRKWPEPRVPAKFEQGGFTSGRRKGPQTLFPGTSPGNLSRSIDRVTAEDGLLSAAPPAGISSGSSAKTATL